MSQFSYYANDFLYFFRDGLREGFAHVNAALGLIIALVAAYMMPAWKRIWATALGATIIHLLAEVMIPVLANQTRFALPSNLLEWSYWRTAIALYLGYLVVIAVFFFVKRNVLPRGATAAHH